VVERTPLTLAPQKLVAELSALLDGTDPEHAVIAFDGDGTLWSGDVGEDLFYAATREKYLLDEARPALLAEAEHYRIPLRARDDANAIASELMGAYLRGEYPERQTCAMMTWCYAGRTLDELSAFSRRVLEEEDLKGRLHTELGPIIAWARSIRLPLVTISASPRAIVEVACEAWGFAPSEIVAATPATNGARIRAKMAAPVPYAEDKVRSGRALFDSARWLAAFGDNVFDVEMLTTAEVGVAVRPKPRLATEVAALGLRLLEPGPERSRASAR
jgi:phosphoserine phosphatase